MHLVLLHILISVILIFKFLCSFLFNLSVSRLRRFFLSFKDIKGVHSKFCRFNSIRRRLPWIWVDLIWVFLVYGCLLSLLCLILFADNFAGMRNQILPKVLKGRNILFDLSSVSCSTKTWRKLFVFSLKETNFLILAYFLEILAEYISICERLIRDFCL